MTSITTAEAAQPQLTFDGRLFAITDRPRHSERLFRRVPGFWRSEEWARQADHLVQMAAHHIRAGHSAARTFFDLTEWTAAQYKSLKNRVEEHNVARWLADRSAAERLVYEVWSQGGWTDDLEMTLHIDPDTHAILSVTTTHGRPVALGHLGGKDASETVSLLCRAIPDVRSVVAFGRTVPVDASTCRVQAERHPTDHARHVLVYAMRESRMRYGIDYFGCFDFGEPRTSVHQPGDAGRLYVANLDNWRNGRSSVGTFFAHYSSEYPTCMEGLEQRGFRRLKDVHRDNWASLEVDCPDVYHGVKTYDLPDDLPTDAPIQVLCWDKPCTLRLPMPPLFRTYLVRIPSRIGPDTLVATAWVATDPENYGEIFRHLDSVFARYHAARMLCHSPARTERILDAVAEIQWYYWQAMPYKRGCAATGDIMTRAMMEAAGIDPPAYSEMVVPDIEAFVFTFEEFRMRLKHRMFEVPVLDT